MIKIKYGDMLKRANKLRRKGKTVVLVVTTNGFVTKYGRAVMGRGIAKKISSTYHIEYVLGDLIENKGNVTQIAYKEKKTKKKGGLIIISLPVKPISMKLTKTTKNRVVEHAIDDYVIGDHVPGFHCIADANIIAKSLKQLSDMLKNNINNYDVCLLPKPGCGAGELDWKDVFPIVWVSDLPKTIVCSFGNVKERKQDKKLMKKVSKVKGIRPMIKGS